MSCTVAIDFGTAYSGYAYILTLHQQEVQRVKRWERRAGADTAKTPTCILFDENGDFMEFGYKARDKYYDICHNTDTYYYFRDFKMELYKQRITRDLQIKDVNKRPISAMKVFSAALRFLKEDALKTVAKDAQNRSSVQNITWVLTVPSIWDSPARQFMRDAAVQAGMDSSNKLQMALEPEAAALWCRTLSAEDFLLDTDDSTDVMMSVGTQYVVVDCGGGTIDITVHEVLEGGALKELHKASGNDKGGWTVDMEFSCCLRQFFCDGLWDEYKRKHRREAQKLVEDFIFSKEAEHSHVRRITVGERFRDMIEKRQKKKKPLFIFMEGLTCHLKSYPAKLEVSEQRAKSFFHDSLDHISKLLSEILQEQKGVRYIVLVGGFSSSHILQQHVRLQFREKAKVLRPKNPQEAILRGALMFGGDPSVIRSRKNAFTYGFSKIMTFDPTKHRPEKKVETADGVWCKHLFRKMVEINEDVGWNETREFSLYPLEGDQPKMSFDFYRTKKKDPMYVDEKDVEGPVASCDVLLPRVSKGMDHEVKLRIYFGSTTIKAEATDTQSHSTVHAKMDFIHPLAPTRPRSVSHSSSVANGNRSHPTSKKHTSVLHGAPTQTSTRSTHQQRERPGEVKPSPSGSHSPSPSDPTQSSSNQRARHIFRPADVDPSPSGSHSPSPSDPTQSSSNQGARHIFRPADVDPSPSGSHSPSPSDPTQSSSNQGARHIFRPGEVKPSPSGSHSPSPSDPTQSSSLQRSQQSYPPGDDDSQTSSV